MNSRRWRLRESCGLPLFFASALLHSSCSTHAPSADSTLPPEPYVRIQNLDSNRVELQIAVRRFAPSRGSGPAIWLTGVSHIGESNYYATLQRHLDAQTLVLFEGVNAASGPTPDASNAEKTSETEKADQAPKAASSRGSLQSALAASLGLVFQLEAVDYTSRHFQNSDLSVEQLRQLMAEQAPSQGRPAAGESFEGLLSLMEGGSIWDVFLQGGLRLLGASPKWQGLGRLALIDTLGPIQGDPAQLRGLPPDLKGLLEVLLERRNQKVVEDLKAELKSLRKKDSVAVFYGTGHMPDLETRLRHDLGYRPSGGFWLTAFSVDLARAGISESEREFLRSLIARQLEGATHR